MEWLVGRQNVLIVASMHEAIGSTLHTPYWRRNENDFCYTIIVGEFSDGT